MYMKKIWMFLFCSLLLVSCFEDQDISADYVEYGRHYDVNSPDPVVRYISQYYEKYGKIIITDPDTADYMFNFQNKHDVFIQKPRSEEDHLVQGLKLLEELFLNSYNDEVKKNIFPYALILADSIKNTANVVHKYEDIYLTANYIAFLVNDEILSKTEEEKVTLSRKWNNDFLEYCIAKIGWTAPEDFYLYRTDGEYKDNWLITGVEKGDMDAVYEKGYPIGEWTYTWKDGKRVEGYAVSSKRSYYLDDFIKFLLSTPQETIDALIAKHARLKQSHDLLDNSLKENFGIDYRTMVYKAKK